MHKEKHYRILSQYVYIVDQNAKDYDPDLKIRTIIKEKDFEYITSKKQNFPTKTFIPII